MRLEQRRSKILGQWHVHLYMNEQEIKQQKKRHIACIAEMENLNISNEMKYELLRLFHAGLIYVEIKKQIT